MGGGKETPGREGPSGRALASRQKCAAFPLFPAFPAENRASYQGDCTGKGKQPGFGGLLGSRSELTLIPGDPGHCWGHLSEEGLWRSGGHWNFGSGLSPSGPRGSPAPPCLGRHDCNGQAQPLVESPTGCPQHTAMPRTGLQQVGEWRASKELWCFEKAGERAWAATVLPAAGAGSSGLSTHPGFASTLSCLRLRHPHGGHGQGKHLPHLQSPGRPRSSRLRCCRAALLPSWAPHPCTHVSGFLTESPPTPGYIRAPENTWSSFSMARSLGIPCSLLLAPLLGASPGVFRGQYARQ